MNDEVIFLKLGGSLITNKDIPYKVEDSILGVLSAEISNFLKNSCGVKLLIGHGSGSFGHTSASQFHTRHGVASHEEWLGFQKVCFDARSLNQIVVQSLQSAGVPVISFPPSTQVISNNHEISFWDTTQIQFSLKNGLVPVIFGDTVFDSTIGGTILSTEELFFHLAEIIRPTRILLAGIEEGVWSGYPSREELVKRITPSNYGLISSHLHSSASVDVTGGMTTKIESMLNLIKNHSHLSIHVFSGRTRGNLSSVLSGSNLGTEICNDQKGGSHD